MLSLIDYRSDDPGTNDPLVVMLSKQEKPVVGLKLPVIARAPEIGKWFAALNGAKGDIEVVPRPPRVVPSQDVGSHWRDGFLVSSWSE